MKYVHIDFHYHSMKTGVLSYEKDRGNILENIQQPDEGSVSFNRYFS